MTTPRTAAGRALVDRLRHDEWCATRLDGSEVPCDCIVSSLPPRIAAIEAEAIRQERARLAEAVEREFAEMREDDPDARWLGMTREGVLALLREENTPNG